ncbi:MAG: anion permease [Deltaproteobacteria bacterium]|nr:anion permease [Deltaproteobacteria bacterium]
MTALSTDILIVLALLAMAMLLFITEWVRVDVVGILMIVALPLTGVISAQDAISGFGSNAVISIIAVIIIGAGLDKSGAMNLLSRFLIRLGGKRRTRIMALLSGAVSVISGFMQNIGAMSLFLPAATRISKQLQISISGILMPMGFCAIIGGCLTLVGSSPLIMLNDLMASWWSENPEAVLGRPFEPFGLFSVMPIGLALLATGLLYFIFFGKMVLPADKGKTESGFMSSYLDHIYGERVGKIFELTVPIDFPRQSLEALKLRPMYHATVDCIAKDQCRIKMLAPSRTDVIDPGDVVGIISTEQHIGQLARDLGWTIKKDLEVFAEDLSPANAGIVEAIVTPHSELAGKKMRDIHFRKRYQVNPLAIFRDQEVHLSDISDMKLKSGDAILFQGQWTKFPHIKDKLDLVFTEDIQHEIMRPEKIPHAVICLTISLILILGLKVSLPIALMTGAVGMVLSKVLTIDEAYSSVDWMTVFLLSGLIPLGIAFEKTGAAHFLATLMMNSIGVVSPLMLMFLIGILVTFFTLVASNVGATVLLVPLAMNMAVSVGADPRMAALVVGVAASNTFILPTHQVNALIMRPGGYKTLDYVKAGIPMTILFAGTVLTMLYLCYGVTL